MIIKGKLNIGKGEVTRFVMADDTEFKVAAAEGGCATKFSLKGGKIVLDVSKKYALLGIGDVEGDVVIEGGRVKVVGISKEVVEVVE